MTDAAALHRAIMCDPADDTVRLAYADWLEENGQPERAEFIRVQVRIAVLLRGWAVSSEGAPPELDALRARERVLFQVLPPILPQEFDAYVTLGNPDMIGGRPGAGLSRGFVSSLTCTAADWLAHADAVYWHPGQKCSKCEGHGRIERLDSGYMRRLGLQEWDGCKDCGGTREEAGDGKARCPDTAQPLRKVVLTTFPGPDDERMRELADKYRYEWMPTDDREQTNARRFITEMFGKEWPGITFQLPVLVAEPVA